MKTQKAPSLPPISHPTEQINAFTLIEMLMVILVIGILASLLLPVLANGKARAQGIYCVSNLQQLQLAWVNYATDNHDKLAQNVASDSGHYATTPNQAGSQPGQPWASWVLGDASQPDPGLITNGLIYPFMGSWKPYKCPADMKMTSTKPPKPTLRSYAMNCWMDGIPAWPDKIPCVDFQKLTTIGNSLSLPMALVFVEENPGTINDGYWVEDLDSTNRWIDSPAHYHVNAGGLAFADGHAEMRKWSDRNVLANYGNAQYGFPSDPKSGDLVWVQKRCTVFAK